MVPGVTPERTAVLVVRVWTHGDPPRLVGRITSTLDVSRSERMDIEVVGEDRVAAAVRAWLEDVARQLDVGDGPVTEP